MQVDSHSGVVSYHHSDTAFDPRAVSLPQPSAENERDFLVLEPSDGTWRDHAMSLSANVARAGAAARPRSPSPQSHLLQAAARPPSMLPGPAAAAPTPPGISQLPATSDSSLARAPNAAVADPSTRALQGKADAVSHRLEDAALLELRQRCQTLQKELDSSRLEILQLKTVARVAQREAAVAKRKAERLRRKLSCRNSRKETPTGAQAYPKDQPSQAGSLECGPPSAGAAVSSAARRPSAVARPTTFGDNNKVGDGSTNDSAGDNAAGDGSAGDSAGDNAAGDGSAGDSANNADNDVDVNADDVDVSVGDNADDNVDVTADMGVSKSAGTATASAKRRQAAACPTTSGDDSDSDSAGVNDDDNGRDGDESNDGIGGGEVDNGQDDSGNSDSSEDFSPAHAAPRPTPGERTLSQQRHRRVQRAIRCDDAVPDDKRGHDTHHKTAGVLFVSHLSPEHLSINDTGAPLSAGRSPNKSGKIRKGMARSKVRLHATC